MPKSPTTEKVETVGGEGWRGGGGREGRRNGGESKEERKEEETTVDNEGKRKETVR